jgi:hypothetical protein
MNLPKSKKDWEGSILEMSPILILGFRRPENIGKIIDAIRPNYPRQIYFAVDGPRKGKKGEIQLVVQTQLAIDSIDWECDLKIRFRDQNLGIRKAVPDAVSWVLESNEEVIVIEDDAIPGPDLLEFMHNQLEAYRDDANVAHISGYNLVPVDKISQPNNLTRISIYPESYLWGTWAKAWTLYKDDIDDYGSIVQKMNLSKVEKLIWRINFRMAHRDLVQSWAYRWIAAMWRENKVCISPNVNLTSYIGSQDGTHTRRKSHMTELEISRIDPHAISTSIETDLVSEAWISRKIFHASALGLFVHCLSFAALKFIKLVGSD